jgi:hypothetical protein
LRFQTLPEWSLSNRNMFIFIALPFLIISIFGSWALNKFTKSSSKTGIEIHKAGSEKFKGPDRTPGIWKPVHFVRPIASPYPEWNVHTTKPLPYRPFRHGPYHITMGLRTMKWDEWIELDSQFPKFHAIKSQRIKDRGAKCSKTAPEAYDGACELLEEL